MKYKNEFKVGISIFLAVLVFIFGVRYFQGMPLFSGSYPLITDFEQVNGLIAGNPVLINGVTVGDVGEVILDQQDQEVRVSLRISEEVRVPEGSVVKLTGFSQLGGVRLVIEPGPVTNPPLDPGDYIPSRQGESFLGNLSEEAAPIISRLDSLLTTATVTVAEAEEQLVQPSSDFRTTLSNLRSITATLNQLLRSERNDLQQIVENTRQITGAVQEFTAENADSLSVTIDNLNASIAHLESTLTAIDRLSASLNELATSINQGEGTLGRLATDPELYERLNTLALNLNQLVTDFQEHPERYLEHVRFVEVF